jgi:hypothetical protein
LPGVAAHASPADLDRCRGGKDQQRVVGVVEVDRYTPGGRGSRPVGRGGGDPALRPQEGVLERRRVTLDPQRLPAVDLEGVPDLGGRSPQRVPQRGADAGNTPARLLAQRGPQAVDRSSAGLVKVLGNLDGVNLTIVPFRLGRRPFLRSVPTDEVAAKAHV